MSDVSNETYSASRLFSLKPIGIGTPYVESLASYIKRLAEIHQVRPGTLLCREILPYLPSNVSIGSFIGKNPRININSFSIKIIDPIVKILEQRTHNENLSFLSIYGWRDFIDQSYALRKFQAWCPICYEDSLESGQHVYEQNIWNFHDIKVCRIHNIELVSRCPYCNSEFMAFKYTSRVGYCTNCSHWLGSKVLTSKIAHNSKWYRWVNENIGQILSSPTPKNRVQVLINIMQLKIMLEKMRGKDNVPEIIINRWRHTKASLLGLLYLSYKLNHSVYDLLTKDNNVKF